MTGFELIYHCLRPFEHPLYQHIWRTLRATIVESTERITLLDVGGRRSNYTIGLEADIWITDIPRENVIQEELDLGATDEIKTTVISRRSNVRKYLYDDMTATILPETHFDIITAIEVLEHVENDDVFLASARRLLCPGGTFIMTTPNGDYIPVPYPDHKRHYKMDELKSILKKHFTDVKTEYRVNSGKLFRIASNPWTVKAPLRTLISMCAFFASDLLEFRLGMGGKGPAGKLHLVAVCHK